MQMVRKCAETFLLEPVLHIFVIIIRDTATIHINRPLTRLRILREQALIDFNDHIAVFLVRLFEKRADRLPPWITDDAHPGSLPGSGKIFRPGMVFKGLDIKQFSPCPVGHDPSVSGERAGSGGVKDPPGS